MTHDNKNEQHGNNGNNGNKVETLTVGSVNFAPTPLSPTLMQEHIEGIMDAGSKNPPTPVLATANDTEPKLTIGYILQQMEKIRADSGHIHEALIRLQEMAPHAPSQYAQDSASEAKAKAINAVITAREATNQKLLDMYNTMYQDIKPESTLTRSDALSDLLSAVRHVADAGAWSEDFSTEIEGAIRKIFIQ